MTSNLKNVPPNWQKVRFDEIVEIATDRVEDPVESGLEYFIGLEHLDTDCIRIKRFGSSEDVCSSKFICKKGDIIFGRRRSYLRKVAITDRDAVVSTDAMVFRPSGDKIYPDFLPCFMQSSIFWKAVHANSEGSMSPRIKWKALATQEFWLPSIEEQKKISELLWSIEDNIQKTEKLIETTEKLKQELLNELLTKGIGHTRFKDSELGRIPGEWEVVKLKNITTKVTDGTHKTPKYTQNGVPFLRVTDIQNNTIDWDKVKYISQEEHQELVKRCHPQKGDILLSKNGTIGIPKIIEWEQEFSIFVSLCLIKVHRDIVNVNYLYQILKSDVVLKQYKLRSKKGTVTNLHLEEIRELEVPLPPISEQEKIVQYLIKVESFEVSYKEHLEKLIGLKKKIASNMISGKLTFKKFLPLSPLIRV